MFAIFSMAQDVQKPNHFLPHEQFDYRVDFLPGLIFEIEFDHGYDWFVLAKIQKCRVLRQIHP